MVCLSWEWLKWPGEVNVQCSIFGYRGYGKWCYSNETGVGIGYTWCKEALGTKRPRNRRKKYEFDVQGQKLCNKGLFGQFLIWESFGVF